TRSVRTLYRTAWSTKVGASSVPLANAVAATIVGLVVVGGITIIAGEHHSGPPASGLHLTTSSTQVGSGYPAHPSSHIPAAAAGHLAGSGALKVAAPVSVPSLSPDHSVPVPAATPTTTTGRLRVVNPLETGGMASSEARSDPVRVIAGPVAVGADPTTIEKYATGTASYLTKSPPPTAPPVPNLGRPTHTP